MSKNNIEKKDQIFCVFNNNKENINIQIQKSFLAYLKDCLLK